jgi:RNA polymerase sigma factor (sigma-70 family)
MAALTEIPIARIDGEVPASELAWARRVARGVARRLPPSFESADLEQVAQIACWRAWGKWQPARNDSFRGYAWAAVHGAALMLARRGAWTAGTAEALSDDAAGAIPHPGQAMDEAWLTRVLLEECIPLLPDAQVYAVTRLFFDGASWDEVSGELHISIGTLHALRQAALSNLRTMLLELGIDSSAVVWQ